MQEGAATIGVLHELTYNSDFNLTAGKMISGKRVSGTITYVVYVEGESDQCLFVNFLDPDAFKVFPVVDAKGSHGGKQKVLEYVANNNQHRRNSCFGIVDRDYDEFVPGFHGHGENICVTDKRDVECMMLSTEAFERMYSECINRKRFGDSGTDREKVRNILIQLCWPIGILRLLNCKLNWEMNFQDLSWEQYVDAKRWQPNILHIIDSLVSKPSGKRGIAPQCRGITESTVLEKCKEAASTYREIDPWLICRGHDVVDAFRLFFSKKKSDYSMEGYLRSGYSMECFAKTKLAEDIEKWKMSTATKK